MAIKIGLDAGHGGKGYTGTYSIDTDKDGLWEKDYALEVVLLMDRALRRNGFETYLTRKGDYHPGDTSQRAIACAKAGCSFAVSIHFNGFENQSANGTEVFVPYAEAAAGIEVGFRECLLKYFKERKPFARSSNINNQNEIFDKKLNTETRKFDAVSAKKDYFGFVRSAWQYGLSADLLEICFLTNRKDFDTFTKNKGEIAEGLAKAIVEGFGKKFVPAKKPKPDINRVAKKNRMEMKK